MDTGFRLPRRFAFENRPGAFRIAHRVDINHRVERILEVVVGGRCTLHASLYVSLGISVDVTPKLRCRKSPRLSCLHPASNFVGSGKRAGWNCSVPAAGRIASIPLGTRPPGSIRGRLYSSTSLVIPSSASAESDSCASGFRRRWSHKPPDDPAPGTRARRLRNPTQRAGSRYGCFTCFTLPAASITSAGRK